MVVTSEALLDRVDACHSWQLAADEVVSADIKQESRAVAEKPRDAVANFDVGYKA